MNLLYDLHTHILPKADDGAKSIDQALEIIKVLSDNGVNNICLTPHFYTHKESIEDFLSRRKDCFTSFAPNVPKGINVRLGAEVYVTEYLFSENRDLSPLCLEGTNYMLVEFSYDSTFSGKSLHLIEKLLNYGITPILAHIERYPKLLKNTKLIGELIEDGVLIQSNIASFTNSSSKRKLLKLIKNGYIHVLSTDVHSLEHNSPALIPMALEAIEKKCGKEAIEILNNNASDIFDF